MLLLLLLLLSISLSVSLSCSFFALTTALKILLLMRALEEDESLWDLEWRVESPLRLFTTRQVRWPLPLEGEEEEERSDVDLHTGLLLLLLVLLFSCCWCCCWPILLNPLLSCKISEGKKGI